QVGAPRQPLGGPARDHDVTAGMALRRLRVGAVIAYRGGQLPGRFADRLELGHLASLAARKVARVTAVEIRPQLAAGVDEDHTRLERDVELLDCELGATV